MNSPHIRSLNLSTSVAVVVFEALRRMNRLTGGVDESGAAL
jgi:tRNA(Leu) C34 or U34 (ribose-2'-O)-methylase TrmL